MDEHEKRNEKNGLFIPSRQVSAYTALLLVFVGSVFMAGYFLGKKQGVDQLVAKIEQDSFSDQIYASFCALYEHAPSEKAAIVTTKAPSLDGELPAKEKGPKLLQKEAVAVAQHASEQTSSEAKPSSKFYAQLIGYGTKKAAESFVQKLEKKGVTTFVKTRSSQTAQGKKTTWYQVVTEHFDDRDSLEEMTHKVAREERIQGIRIIAC